MWFLFSGRGWGLHDTDLRQADGQFFCPLVVRVFCGPHVCCARWDHRAQQSVHSRAAVQAQLLSRSPSCRLPHSACCCLAGSRMHAHARPATQASAHERLLKDFGCSLCKGVLQQPLSMPCGHNFCKGCLDKRFAEAEAAQAQGSKALAEAKPARSLRVRKVGGVGAGLAGAAQHFGPRQCGLAGVVWVPPAAAVAGHPLCDHLTHRHSVHSMLSSVAASD